MFTIKYDKCGKHCHSPYFWSGKDDSGLEADISSTEMILVENKIKGKLCK